MKVDSDNCGLYIQMHSLTLSREEKKQQTNGGHPSKEERLRDLLCTGNNETTLGASSMEVTMIGQGIGLHHGKGK